MGLFVGIFLFSKKPNRAPQDHKILNTVETIKLQGVKSLSFTKKDHKIQRD